MNNRNTYSVHFGSLALPIRKQLNNQGFDLDIPLDEIGALQKCADGISLLKIKGFLTEREGAHARERLLRKIKSCVCVLKTESVPSYDE